jgi:hypothetical protein
MRKNKEPERFFYNIQNPEVGKAYDEDKMDDEVLSNEEKAIGEDLSLEFQKASKNFETFLQTEYIRFDYRMNMCMLKRCYSNIFFSRDKIRSCSLQCQEGMGNMNDFISKLMEETNDQLASCIQKAQQTETEIMDESFKCYKYAIDQFAMLKKIITQEFSFYKS